MVVGMANNQINFCVYIDFMNAKQTLRSMIFMGIVTFNLSDHPSKIIVLNSMNHCNRIFIRYVHVFLLLTVP